MPAYVFGNITKINDPARFSRYQDEGMASIKKYGGKVLGGGTKVEIADGDWQPVLALAVEFENLAKAKEWYYSPEYQAAVVGRLESAEGGVIFIDGD